jgi:hypothetical protein
MARDFELFHTIRTPYCDYYEFILFIQFILFEKWTGGGES